MCDERRVYGKMSVVALSYILSMGEEEEERGCVPLVIYICAYSSMCIYIYIIHIFICISLSLFNASINVHFDYFINIFIRIFKSVFLFVEI